MVGDAIFHVYLKQVSVSSNHMVVQNVCMSIGADNYKRQCSSPVQSSSPVIANSLSPYTEISMPILHYHESISVLS